MRTLTISEAAELTGLSRKALARRIERGSIRCVVRDGRRRIPMAELVRVGLVDDDAQTGDEFDPRLFLPGASRPQANVPVPYDASQTLAAVVRELFDRFERQAAEIASFRAVTMHSESLRMTSELADLRARIAQLETQGRPGELVSRAPAETSRVPTPPRAPSGPLARKDLWLPAGAQPSAQSTAPHTSQDQAQLEIEIARLRSHLAQLEARRPPRRLGRAPRLLIEAVFIAAVAVGVWFAELGTEAIFAFMAAAWIVVAVIESVSWHRD